MNIQKSNFLKDRTWTVIALLCALLFIYVLTGPVMETGRDVLHTRRSAEKYRYKIEQVENPDFSLEYLEKRKENLRKQVEELVAEHQDNSRLSGILSFISKTAGKEKISIITIKPGEPSPSGRHVELPVEITLKTRYHKLGKFINTIEDAGQLIKVNRFNIKSEKMTSSLILAELELLVYYTE